MINKLHLYITGLVLALSLPLSMSGQNVQLHYDWGHSLYRSEMDARPQLTTTVELFRPDKWGSTFLFVDMNYQDSGITSAYWEIARDIKLGRSPLALHLEYNGGLTNHFSLKNAYLLGLNYSWNSKDYRWGWGLSTMYKHLAKQGHPHSAQVTATWYANLGGGLVSLSGFADLWGDRDLVGQNIAVFLAEPQLWINLKHLKGISKDFNLSIGAELELSYNFPVGGGKLYAVPTLATKWTF